MEERDCAESRCRRSIHVPDASGGRAGWARLMSICGMALEPVMPSGDLVDDGELRKITRRPIVGAIPTGPLLVLAMGPQLLPFAVQRLVETALATPVVAYCGWPFFVRAARSLATRKLNMFTLLGRGVSVAYGYGLIVVVAPSLFPTAMNGDRSTPTWWRV